MSASKIAEVLVTGLNIVDILFRMPATVHPGEKHEIGELLIQGGAPAGNAACLLASLGWQTGFIARSGDDTLSGIARAEFSRHGVLDSYFISDSSAVPGVSVVQINATTGERTVFYTQQGYRSLQLSDIPVAAVKSARLILVDGYETEAAMAMLEAAQGTECRSVLDVEVGDPTILRKLIELGTDTILPLGAALRLSGESDVPAALKKLSEWTSGQLLVTDGPRGSWAWTPQGILHQPGFHVSAVDTTGCGDAYHAAYASAMLDGMPLQLRMEFASWVAAQIALKLGGRSNLPTRNSIKSANHDMLSTDLRTALKTAVTQ